MRRPTLAGVSVLVIGVMFAVALGLAVSAGLRNPAAPPAPGPKQKVAEPKAAPISIGSVGKLDSGSGVAVLGATEADFKRWSDLSLAGDKIGQMELVAAGRVLLVEGGTRGRVIGSSWGGLFEVRIESGEHLGRSGWLPREWVRP